MMHRNMWSVIVVSGPICRCEEHVTDSLDLSVNFQNYKTHQDWQSSKLNKEKKVLTSSTIVICKGGASFPSVFISKFFRITNQTANGWYDPRQLLSTFRQKWWSWPIEAAGVKLKNICICRPQIAAPLETMGTQWSSVGRTPGKTSKAQPGKRILGTVQSVVGVGCNV